MGNALSQAEFADWDASTEYSGDTQVAFDGSVYEYINDQASSGNEPGGEGNEHWKLLHVVDTDTYNTINTEIGDEWNLDDYELYTQVQLYYSNGTNNVPVTHEWEDKDGNIQTRELTYFVADQLFVLWNDDNETIEDVIIIENKLSADTRLSANQEAALDASHFKVRSTEVDSLGEGPSLTNLVAPFENLDWFMIRDNSDGTGISGVHKIK